MTANKAVPDLVPQDRPRVLIRRLSGKLPEEIEKQCPRRRPDLNSTECMKRVEYQRFRELPASMRSKVAGGAKPKMMAGLIGCPTFFEMDHQKVLDR